MRFGESICVSVQTIVTLARMPKRSRTHRLKLWTMLPVFFPQEMGQDLGNSCYSNLGREFYVIISSVLWPWGSNHNTGTKHCPFQTTFHKTQQHCGKHKDFSQNTTAVTYSAVVFSASVVCVEERSERRGAPSRKSDSFSLSSPALCSFEEMKRKANVEGWEGRRRGQRGK